MKIVCIIPARYHSTRLKGKVLLRIKNKPIIQYVYEKAKRSKLINEVYIATDDKRIYNTCKNFGAKCFITSKKHKSGTDRCAEVAKKIDCSLVVNLQADEPLINPSQIDKVILAFTTDNKHRIPNKIPFVVSTLVKKIKTEDELNNPNVVKVVFDKNNYALYFSRSPIPFSPPSSLLPHHLFYKHIGIYVYTKDFLLKFVNLPYGKLEKIEQLEQLRILENGYKIKVVETKYDTIGVDTEEDFEKVRKIIEFNNQV